MNRRIAASHERWQQRVANLVGLHNLTEDEKIYLSFYAEQGCTAEYAAKIFRIYLGIPNERAN